MNTELQRITQELDHETIARIELENCKQTLEDEIHFMKKIHAEEIEEMKHMNIIGTSLDPTRFFQNELVNAVQQIRQEYEQLNDQQRTELQTWYQMKVTQAVRWRMNGLKGEMLLRSIRLQKFNHDELLKKRRLLVNRKKSRNCEQQPLTYNRI